MKNLIYITILLMSTLKIEAQQSRKLIPFMYNDKWGLVDSLGNEVVEPKYENEHIFHDFMYAEFDGKDLYNLKTGEKTKALGEYKSSINLGESKYHLFFKEEASILINFEEKETIKLSQKFIYIKQLDLFNKNNESASSILLAYHDDETISILKNDKELTPVIAEKIETIDFELIENSKYNQVGFVVKKRGNYIFYNHQITKIGTFKAPNESNYYDLLTKEVENKLFDIYNIEGVRSGCSNCESPWDDSWEFDNESIDTKNTDYYFEKEGYDVFLKRKKFEDLKIEVNPSYYNYNGDRAYKKLSLRLHNLDNSMFFYDSRYMKPNCILFPKKYLSQD